MQLQQSVPPTLIASYYEGITSPRRFSEALQQMAELLGCDHASLALWDRRGNWGCAYQALRQQHAWQLSMQDNAMPAVEMRKLVAGLETGKWKILEQQFHLAPALPKTAQPEDAALCIRLLGGQGVEAFLSFKRNRFNWRTATPAMHFADALAQPLKAALNLMMQMRCLKQQAAQASTVLDCIRMPLLMLDKSLRVVVANTAARSLLCMPHNGGAGTKSMTLAGVPAERLINLVRRACVQTEPAASVLQINASDTQPAMQIVVLPIPSKTAIAANERAALVLVSGHPGGQESADQLLQHLYCLTPAEARLALLILHGTSPSAAAEQLRVSLPTVRTQLSAVLKKTGALRQSDLVRRLSALLLINQRLARH